MKMRQWLSGSLAVLMLAIVLVAVLPIEAEAETDAGAKQADRLKEIYSEIFPTGDIDKNPSFFTANGEACGKEHISTSNAGTCTNCSLRDVLMAFYEKDPAKYGAAYKLGYSYAKNETTYNGGKTCVGFKRFVWLYVYEEKEWENENYLFEKQKSTYDLMSKLQPGDVVDLYKNVTSLFVHPKKIAEW